MKEQFTKYEIARIMGARALQIAMDAPILLKLSEDELKKMKYDALAIAEKELYEGVLPITINRPSPKRGTDKLKSIKGDTVSDEEILERKQEVEKEIIESAEELGFVNAGEEDTEDLEEADEQ